MLVHKKTMGVLNEFWTGKTKKQKDGKIFPVMEEYTFENTCLPENEWWYIPSKSSLGRRLIILYPYCKPIIDENGILINIEKEDETTTENSNVDTPENKKSRQRRRNKSFFDIM